MGGPATVNLRVSADEERVEDGQFNIQGILSKEMAKVQASKIWEKAEEDITLEVEVPPGELFKFEGGHLYSEYLDQGKVKYRARSGAGSEQKQRRKGAESVNFA